MHTQTHDVLHPSGISTPLIGRPVLVALPSANVTPHPAFPLLSSSLPAYMVVQFSLKLAEGRTELLASS